jgi:hypothetical protein
MTRLSADTRYRRRLAWLHNGFIGSCAMTQGAMASIIDSPTATDGATEGTVEGKDWAVTDILLGYTSIMTTIIFVLICLDRKFPK